MPKMRSAFGLQVGSIQEHLKQMIPADTPPEKLAGLLPHAIASAFQHNNTKQLDVLRRLGVVPQGADGWVEFDVAEGDESATT